jgi:hypothetical protein
MLNLVSVGLGPEGRQNRVAGPALRLDIFRLNRERGIGVSADHVVLGGFRVGVGWEPVNFGGARPWFLCPGCSARRRFMYLPRVLCHTCADLTYASRHANWNSARPLRRAAKLRRLLGVPEAPFADIPPKAKGWRTRPAVSWESVVREIELCEREALGAIVPVHVALTRRKVTP